jgi:hypothetical protein
MTYLNNHVYSYKKLQHELAKQQLINQQKDKEIQLLNEKINDLKS